MAILNLKVVLSSIFPILDTIIQTLESSINVKSIKSRMTATLGDHKEQEWL